MSDGPPLDALRILEEALQLPEAERRAFLDARCESDEGFRAELESILLGPSEAPLDSTRQTARVETDAEAGAESETQLEFGAAIRPVAEDDPIFGRRESDELVGSTIGPYRVLEPIGEGGMGRVWLAEQTRPVRRRVALKTLKLGMDSEEILKRFEAERQALAILNHANIASVFDAGLTPKGQPYFAMEYVPGVPLTNYCDEARLSLEKRLELFVQVCRGVEHAHSRGIIHRDLKPANILVCDADDGPIVKIIDFGIAKATGQRLTEETLYTQLGWAVGTPSYMSPEQAGQSSRDLDKRTDVYSLGVILYEVLIGDLPIDEELFRKAGLEEVSRLIREEDPPTPSTRWQRLSRDRTLSLSGKRSSQPSALWKKLRGDLDCIVMKALEKERHRRYASPRELADDIEHFLRNEPVSAGPPGITYRLKRSLRRHRLALMVVAAIGVTLLVGFVASTYLWLRASHYADLSEKNADLLASRLTAAAGRLRLVELRDKAAPLERPLLRNLPAMRAWVGEARQFAAELPKWRSELAALQAFDETSAKNEDPEAGDSTARVADELGAFLTDAERFASDEISEEGALLARIGRSIDELEKRSGASADDVWKEVREDIARTDSVYGGLTIQRETELWPLGEDPHSGFHEFLCLDTGAPPERKSDGSWRLSEETGIILVLLPGGTFTMGAIPIEAEPDAKSLTSKGNERPAHEVRLDPFYISKYEVTQAQWARMANQHPSYLRPPLKMVGVQITPLHPVDSITWKECIEGLRPFGLDLPTEAQWEYAARAGTRTPWWTGARRETLIGKVNICDQAAVRSGEGWPVKRARDWPEFEDGYAYHAPVDSFEPNPFGLYCIIGNMLEWCRDGMTIHYGALSMRPGDAFHEQGHNLLKIARGGGFHREAGWARVSARDWYEIPERQKFMGFRPARKLR